VTPKNPAIHGRVKGAKSQDPLVKTQVAPYSFHGTVAGGGLLRVAPMAREATLALGATLASHLPRSSPETG